MFDRLAPTAAGSMPMDIFEKDGTYHARFDLPGVDPETVELTVENSILTVTVERPVEDTEGANWLMRERPAGRHSRQIRLGPLVDTETLTLPTTAAC
ncbi:MAG: Hsp20/alpha crystallin family protein [Acidimicrobiia bacterium]